MCGIFAVTKTKDASKTVYLGLFALQHRGQESAGISALEGESISSHRGLGLVADVFQENDLARLKGETALGHVRYSTTGGNVAANVQPMTARVGSVSVALAHNGNIVNSESIRKQLEDAGSILQGSSDTELVLHLIARSEKATFFEKLKDALQKLEGAFSLLVLTSTHLYAVVDRYGYRPLSVGKMKQAEGSPGEQSWVFSSETCAMDLVDATLARDVAPGEILSVNLATDQLESAFFHNSKEESLSEKAHCVFEHVYFSRPDSLVWGLFAHDVRFAMGCSLARTTSTVAADMVIAVPDSGTPMAMGYAHASGIPFRIGLIRNHYVGRTFIEPTQNARNFRVRLKLNPMRETIRGKRVIVVDDSIVRGTTSKKIIELLREAGAKEVHLRISSPPVRFPCFYGIDTPRRQDLLARKMDIKEMAALLNTDSLDFLSEENLLAVMDQFQPAANASTAGQAKKMGKDWCTACFSGRYQDASLRENMESSPRDGLK